MSIDYKALIADRKSKQTRPLVREVVCLSPELYAELEEAKDVLEAAHRDTIGDERAGGTGDAAVSKAKAEVAKVEARIAEASVVAIFKAPTATRQGQQSDELAKLTEEQPERVNELVVESAKKSLLEAFDHFEGPGQKRLDLTHEDLSTVLDEWAQGEVLAVHRKLAKASTGAPDLPFSVRQSLGVQRSAGTSNSH